MLTPQGRSEKGASRGNEAENHLREGKGALYRIFLKGAERGIRESKKERGKSDNGKRAFRSRSPKIDRIQGLGAEKPLEVGGRGAAKPLPKKKRGR